MKVAIDGRGINWYHGTGIGTYTDNLLKNLIKIDKDNFYNIYWSGDNYNNYKNNNTKIIMTSCKNHRFFQQHYFPYNLNSQCCDIYHVPQNGIGLSPDIKCSKVVTVHDLIPYVMPETVGKGYLIKFLKEMPWIIDNSQGILTVSEFSKKDIMRFFPIDESRIFVTPLAADKIFKPLEKETCRLFIKEHYGITKPFALYLGGFSERKNIDSLIKAFAKSYKNLEKDCVLLILGSYRDDSQKLLKLAENLGINKNIIFVGFVPQNELPMFYNASEVFVYPSFYEGFGLPPLEAMSCGTPVISSNLTSIPEVVEDNGILIDPYSLNSLSIAIEKVLNDNNLKKELSIKGLAHSKKFSWDKTARKTLKAYESIHNMS